MSINKKIEARPEHQLGGDRKVNNELREFFHQIIEFDQHNLFLRIVIS